MEYQKNLKTIFFQLLLIAMSGCSHLATIDRAHVNKPAMDLNSPMAATNQSTLTNQKSSTSISVGSCSVCAH